jgi:hypothetical protein
METGRISSGSSGARMEAGAVSPASPSLGAYRVEVGTPGAPRVRSSIMMAIKSIGTRLANVLAAAFPRSDFALRRAEANKERTFATALTNEAALFQKNIANKEAGYLAQTRGVPDEFLADLARGTYVVTNASGKKTELLATQRPPEGSTRSDLADVILTAINGLCDTPAQLLAVGCCGGQKAFAVAQEYLFGHQPTLNGKPVLPNPSEQNTVFTMTKQPGGVVCVVGEMTQSFNEVVTVDGALSKVQPNVMTLIGGFDIHPDGTFSPVRASLRFASPVRASPG